MIRQFLKIIIFTFFLNNISIAEILRLGCVEPEKSDEIVEYKFDLKRNVYTTITGTEIDAAFTEEEIIFQSQLFDKILVSFQISRLTGLGSISMFNYNDEFNSKAKEMLPIEFSKVELKYPDNAKEQNALIAIRNFAHSEFKPASKSKLKCEKLTKKF